MGVRAWLRGTTQQHSYHSSRTGRYYVYHLRYPNEPAFGILAGTTFYIGKGTHDRVLQHEAETRRILKSGRMMDLSHKHKTIIQVWDAGYDVWQVIVDRTDDEEEAYQIEAKQIRDFGLERLTNATYGWKPRRKRGRT